MLADQSWWLITVDFRLSLSSLDLLKRKNMVWCRRKGYATRHFCIICLDREIRSTVIVGIEEAVTPQQSARATRNPSTMMHHMYMTRAKSQGILDIPRQSFGFCALSFDLLFEGSRVVIYGMRSLVGQGLCTPRSLSSARCLSQSIS